MHNLVAEMETLRNEIVVLRNENKTMQAKIMRLEDQHSDVVSKNLGYYEALKNAVSLIKQNTEADLTRNKIIESIMALLDEAKQLAGV